ncbi:BppU family phage baseplate upper protein [Paraclostridium sordellii]|uniref:BppU family phage baseplate upper protein n=1 Tax=Paraclostridium sordellii TaxID=1505 RepID=UPI0005E48DF7|nr:BppU family phage baseplate upper protein [Paeniclostridium sordellii]CEN81004.1 phage pre-neck appendage-like protein [[Clostridium] sordellii] [Paeniclostridium sordellii]
MLNRKYNLKLDLQFRCNNSNMEFNQFDKNTSDFFIQINRSGKEMDLSKALVTLMVIKPNGNVDSQFLEVAEGGVYASLKPSLKDIPGDYQCKAIVTVKDETVIPDQVFTYTVNEDKFLAAFNQNMTSNEDYTLLTDILGRLSTIETDEQQRQINEAERILNEESRKVAENNRTEAELVREHNDADREKAEATRESNEFIRKTSENNRVETEVNRVKAETNRVDAEALRVEAENLRNDNYNFMTSDEERRRNEENARIEAEKLRKQAESTRVNQESQRRTTEQARVLKENERNSNEISREANEVSRKANEEKRVQAETNRSNRYDNFIADAESAANSFKTYTSTAKQEEETRKANELTRIETEDRRVSNEIKRISDENTRKDNENKRVESETNRQSKFDTKIIEVDNKVIEVNVAKDTVIADTEEAINTMKEDVANAIAAGTNDLEVKEARKDLKGKTHESLKLRIESDFEGLKESQDMAYATDKGYLVCKETKNGTIKDLKISGKSLKNVCAKRDFTIEGDGAGLTHDLGTLTEPIPNDVEYTVIVKVPSDLPNKNCFFRGYDKNGSGKANIFDGDELYNNRGGILVKKVTNAPTYDTPLVNVRLFANTTTGTFKLNDVIVLIDDHTQNPPNGYFEGIASVGDGVDEIEVLSMGKNLCTSEIEIGGINSLGKPYASNVDFRTKDYVKVYPTLGNVSASTNNSDFVVSMILEYDSNFNFISVKPIVNAQLSSNCMYVKFRGRHKTQETDITNMLEGVKFQLEINSTTTSFEDAKQDKKPILFKDVDGSWKHIKELRGLDTVCDTIELHSDGKYYYHQRTSKDLFTGVEDWRIAKTNESTIRFYLHSDSVPHIMNGGECLSDKFMNIFIGVSDVEGIVLGNAYRVNIEVLKSKLQTQDVEGFKKWLQSNNMSVIFQLAEEKVFEVNPLFLEAFEGETMMSINSGVINAPMEFKIASSLPNLVLLNQKRIKELENQMVTMFKSVLNGDMRTLAETIYPEDFIEENRPMLLI